MILEVEGETKAAGHLLDSAMEKMMEGWLIGGVCGARRGRACKITL